MGYLQTFYQRLIHNEKEKKRSHTHTRYTTQNRRSEWYIERQLTKCQVKTQRRREYSNDGILAFRTSEIRADILLFIFFFVVIFLFFCTPKITVCDVVWLHEVWLMGEDVCCLTAIGCTSMYVSWIFNVFAVE